MRLCCLIDGIEEAGIERQIRPYRSAGVKKQWHYGEGGALRQCCGNLGIGAKRPRLVNKLDAGSNQRRRTLPAPCRIYRFFSVAIRHAQLTGRG